MEYHTRLARPQGPLSSSTQMTTSNSFHHQNCFIKFSKHKRRRTCSLPDIPSILYTVIVIIFALHIQSGTTLLASIPVEQKCQPTYSFFCNIPNYSTLLPFNNTLGHATLEEATSSLHSPPDMTTKLLLPCRNICEEAYQCEPEIRGAMNSSWPPEWDCNKFEYYSEAHKLCVIDNQKEEPYKPSLDPQPTTGIGYISHRPTSPPVAPLMPTNIVQDDAICGAGLFDCRSSDPKRPLCIEQRYVCDGKTDCYRNDSYDQFVGLDEMNCKERCEEGQLNCDDKCIGRFDICNGKVDCSSGVDEQDCIDGLIGMIQLVLCVFVMSSAVYILVRFLKVDRDRADKGQPCVGQCEDHHDYISHPPTLIDNKITVIPQETRNSKPLPPQPIIGEMIHNFREPLYQAPSITARSDAYERIIAGGNSGASSVYAWPCSGEDFNIRSSGPSISPPAPPPSRNSLERIYSNHYAN